MDDPRGETKRLLAALPPADVGRVLPEIRAEAALYR